MWRSLKRWPTLAALLVAFVALAVGLVCLPHGSRVTRENCKRIKKGMTEAEVRAILGKPWDNALLDPDIPSPRDYSEAEDAWQQKLLDLEPTKRVERLHHVGIWVGGEVVVFVDFDKENRVLIAGVCSNPYRQLSWLPERVWRRLRFRAGW